jgi:MFS family permease
MARRAAMPKRAALPRRAVGAKRRVRRNTKGVTLAIVGAMVLVVVALPLCLVFVAGMAPTLVAAFTDRNPRRHLLRTIGVLNLAGMVLPVAALLRAGLTVYGAATVLFDPYKWLWMYGTAALGWLIYLGMPSIARVMVEARAVRTEHELQQRAKTLVEEWGEEVTGRKPEAA